MKISTEIKDNIRWQRVTGAIDIKELADYLKTIYHRSDFDPDMDVFWDLQEADFRMVSEKDVKRIADYVGHHWGTSRRSKAAIVVPNDLGFGMSRMYEILLETEYDNKILIFREMAPAIEWIKEKEWSSRIGQFTRR